MPGLPVSIGCTVMVVPGVTLVPDIGVIVGVLNTTVVAGVLPLATAGTICVMVNSLTGIPYPLVIGPLGSLGVSIAGAPLVRLGDMIPSPPGVLAILGPPAAGFLLDSSPP
jgi:hypothetical protein